MPTRTMPISPLTSVDSMWIRLIGSEMEIENSLPDFSAADQNGFEFRASVHRIVEFD